MSASPQTPGAQRHRAILEALEDLALALDDLREVRPQINEPGLRGRLDTFIAAVGAMLDAHGGEPGASLPAQAGTLRQGISQMAIPSRDPELGRTETLRRAQAAEGLFSARLDRLTSLLPETPIASEALPRAETGAVGERIEARLQILEASLQALRDAGRERTGFVQQQGLINLYIQEAKAEISLARFLAKIGETKLDLGAIQAAAQRLAGLTGEFLAMVAGWAGRVSNWLPPLGERLRRGAAGLLRTVALGWKVVGWRRARPSGPLEPDANEVRRRLLAGEEIPAAWVPGIRVVDLSASDFAGTERLAALAKLQSLDLTDTRISDIASLAALENLQSLNLADTRVSDVAPLAALANLQTLNLMITPVSDITPLAALANLQSLNLADTRVSDVAPLAALANLQSLDLEGTQVREITPLAALTNLQSLYLTDAPVSNIAPLAALANLQTLNLRGTQVSDIAPLATLANLQSLYLTDTWVSDVAPLAALANLQNLYLMGTQVSDIAPLAALANLQSLILTDTQVSDIAPLAALANLQNLSLVSTQVSDIAPLATLANLQSLNLADTRVSDVAPLAALTKLERLHLSRRDLPGMEALRQREGLAIHLPDDPPGRSG